MQFAKMIIICYKVARSPSKKICVIYFTESPLKMMIYFILKALFVLKICRFLPCLFGHEEEKARLER